MRTEHGLHIIQLIARRDGQPVAGKQIAASIRRHLFETKFLEAVIERAQALRRKVSVEILISL